LLSTLTGIAHSHPAGALPVKREFKRCCGFILEANCASSESPLSRFPAIIEHPWFWFHVLADVTHGLNGFPRFVVRRREHSRCSRPRGSPFENVNQRPVIRPLNAATARHSRMPSQHGALVRRGPSSDAPGASSSLRRAKWISLRSARPHRGPAARIETEGGSTPHPPIDHSNSSNCRIESDRPSVRLCSRLLEFLRGLASTTRNTPGLRMKQTPVSATDGRSPTTVSRKSPS